MKTRSWISALHGVLALALAAACSEGSTRPRCSTDSDCKDPVLWRCDRQTGFCLCRASGACKTGETCNASGYCVPQGRCSWNRDCPEGLFCETASGTCVAQGRCASDLACNPGEVCERAMSTCKPGCRSNGDCASGQVCVCKTGDGGEEPCRCPVTGELARQICPQQPTPDGGFATGPLGRCAADRCGDVTFCKFGEVCKQEPPAEAPQCMSDYDPRYRPYCDNCRPSPGQDTCGLGPNFCLTAFDPRTSRRYDFCGVDCSQGQSCPNGYMCDDVIVVYGRWQCGSDADCATPERRSGLVCQGDGDCPNGGRCAKDPGATTGFCHGRCGKSEGAGLGFCSCVADDDCFQDSCDPVQRVCTVSKRPCDLAGAGCTSKIRCVDFGGAGGCLIGKNCGPLEGLTCDDVRPR